MLAQGSGNGGPKEQPSAVAKNAGGRGNSGCWSISRPNIQKFAAKKGKKATSYKLRATRYIYKSNKF
jgi:hypothetical protein